jgi:hypothetical protein
MDSNQNQRRREKQESGWLKEESSYIIAKKN